MEFCLWFKREKAKQVHAAQADTLEALFVTLSIK